MNFGIVVADFNGDGHLDIAVTNYESPGTVSVLLGNGASNLICADCGTGNEIDYAYDGNNRRVSRAKGGITTYFVHASNGDLILECTPSTNVTLEHIYLNGKRIATKKLP